MIRPCDLAAPHSLKMGRDLMQGHEYPGAGLEVVRLAASSDRLGAASEDVKGADRQILDHSYWHPVAYYHDHSNLHDRD